MKARLPKEYQNKGAGNMNDMIRQAQKMQEQMKLKQDELAEREFSTAAGGGMIELTMTGAHELKSVKINPDLIDPAAPEDLEDMIIAGVNAVIQKVNEESAAEMDKISGGLNIPGMM
ncbi:MAG: YbaB/EbfC family nucleoid-associated protein [Oscillospiraceae bacterium]|jgi:DNA-binding YbaB/EbfC family protein|nr:YbaB/EbfC family nucleoid-associated protein [Oscillospiraceae bacterium]